MYSNVQSFLNKKREIEDYIAGKKFDLIMLTEVWITKEHCANEYSLHGFQTPVVDFKARGGTLIFVRKDIPFYEVFPPNQCEDASWIVIRTDNHVKRLHACIYRSPNSLHANNEKLLENLSWADQNFNELVIVGDFNFPSINWEMEESTDTQESLFIEKIRDVGLQQMVKEPTRFRHGTAPLSFRFTTSK